MAGNWQRSIFSLHSLTRQSSDCKSKDVQLKLGDRVMLKVEPWFKLDQSFKGPFIVRSLTSTNAVIQLQGDDKTEKIDVSRQQLSLCSPEISNSTPWVGHIGKLRKRRQLSKRTGPEDESANQGDENSQMSKTTCSAQSGNLPSFYW